MGDVIPMPRRPRSRLRSKYFWLFLLFIVLEEASPFVPICGIVLVVGLIWPNVLLWTARHLVACYDHIRGTSYAELIDEVRAAARPNRAA